MSEVLEPVSAGTILDTLGSRSYGVLLGLLAAPNLIPIPVIPASTTILGLFIVLVSAQLAVGRKTPWLPERARAIKLSRETLDRWFSGPEPPALSRAACTATGVLAAANGVVLALPIPFANFLPALAISCFGYGLAQGKTRWLALGAFLTLLTGLVLTGVSRGLVYTLSRLKG